MKYYVIFIYFQATVSALFCLSQFCTLKKIRKRLREYLKICNFVTYQTIFLMTCQQRFFSSLIIYGNVLQGCHSDPSKICSIVNFMPIKASACRHLLQIHIEVYIVKFCCVQGQTTKKWVQIINKLQNRTTEYFFLFHPNFNIEISPKNATKHPVAWWHDHAKHSGLNSIFCCLKMNQF